MRRFVGLSHAERGLFLRAFLALTGTDIRLRFSGLPPLIEHAPLRADAERAVSREDVARAREYARWIQAAARYHRAIRARCLHRSLTLHGWLRREGLPSELRIGVRKDGNALRAHAWVELRGEVVNDQFAAVSGFTPLSEPSGLQTLRRPREAAVQWL